MSIKLEWFHLVECLDLVDILILPPWFVHHSESGENKHRDWFDLANESRNAYGDGITPPPPNPCTTALIWLWLLLSYNYYPIIYPCLNLLSKTQFRRPPEVYQVLVWRIWTNFLCQPMHLTMNLWVRFFFWTMLIEMFSQAIYDGNDETKHMGRK